MTLLLNLYLGHLLGDFVFQPGGLVIAKRRGINGLLIHVGVIGICTGLILIEDLPSLWPILLLAMTAHMIIEVITLAARASSRFSGLTVFLVDQAMHIVSLVILVWLASPRLEIENITTFGLELVPGLIALACAFIAVAFMGSIIIFEITNSFGPDSWNTDILLYDRSRILGMVERTSALVLSVWLGGGYLLIPFLPRLFNALQQKDDERAKRLTVLIASLIICFSGWIFVFYSASKATIGNLP